MVVPAPRPLRTWAWGLAILFLPGGLFIACGAARLLGWSQALFLAVLSQGSLIGFTQLMAHLEQSGASPAVRATALEGGLSLLAAWVFLVFRIGLRKSYWSPNVLRGWKRAGWFAASVLCLGWMSVIVMAVTNHPGGLF
jgi:hypothetical protein